MRPRFTLKWQRQGSTATLKLIGSLNEMTVIAALPAAHLLGIQELKINFDELQAINAGGAREWQRFVSALPPYLCIIYQGCRPDVLEQMRGLHGFAKPGTKISSLYLHFVCDDCGQESEQKLETEHLPKAAISTQDLCPATLCRDCGTEMSPDHDEQSLFYCLQKCS